MYYEYSRWYDPSVGRFISQDSYPGYLSDPQSLNPYVYTENAPTTYADPTGHFIIEALIGAVVGAGVGYGWCVASTGGWTSSDCGQAALIGAGTGAFVGATDGLSLLAGAACEEECPSLTDAGNGAEASSSDAGSTATAGSSDVSASGGVVNPTITSTTSGESTPIITETGGGNTVVSGSAPTSIEVVDISRAGFEEAQSEGMFGNQPTALAQGNYAHQLLGNGEAPTALTPGNFPDQYDANGFTEIKPYHAGIDPLQEYNSQLTRYTTAFRSVFGYYPSVKLILYRYV